MALTLEEMLSPARYATKVNIESMKGDVFMRPMMGRDRERLQDEYKKDAIDGIGLAKESIRLSVCDENGGAIFHNLEEIEQLPGPVQDELAEQAAKVNGFESDAVEVAEKNSDPTRADLVGSVSQSDLACPSPDANGKLIAESLSSG